MSRMGRHSKKFKFNLGPRPSRDQLGGYSCSEFKTLLKKFRFKVGRSLHCQYSILRKSRAYRFRWWNNDVGFVVDISCPLADFDRWANSTEQIVPFKEWVQIEQQRALAKKWLGNIK